MNVRRSVTGKMLFPGQGEASLVEGLELYPKEQTMSAPQAPVIRYEVKADCETCGKNVSSTSTNVEAEAKEGLVKAISAGELHDCKSGPKK
jgi:hypothetical protein